MFYNTNQMKLSILNRILISYEFSKNCNIKGSFVFEGFYREGGRG